MKGLVKIIVAGALLLFSVGAAKAQGFGGQMPDPSQMAPMQADQMKEVVSLTDEQYPQALKIFKDQGEKMQKMMAQFGGGGGF